MNNFPIIKNTTPSTSEKNLNFINEMISNTLFNRKTNGEINLHEFSSKAKTFRSYDKFLDTNELDAEKLKEIKAFMNSIDKLEPIRDGLICWLDGRDGNNNDRTTIWKDRSGNGNDATLVGFDFNENSGWGDGCVFVKYYDTGPKKFAKTKIFETLDSSNYTMDICCSIDKENNIDEFIASLNKNNNTTSGQSIGIFKYKLDGSVNYHSRLSNGSWVPTNRIKTDVRPTFRYSVVGYQANKNTLGLFLNSTKQYQENTSELVTISDPTLLLFSQTEIESIEPSVQALSKNVSIYSARIYSRALTPEEIRHNYLYDLSVQYLLKNQANSNTIETYYEFDPNYDLPDNRVEGCLMVSNGRLVYYNPSGSAPLRIANNKTLDECIVEETEDYIIYSDGEVTVENPIPEGIYFACRVDKHTGEIYYGEGYENLARSGRSSVYVTREDLYHKYTMFKKIKHQNENAWGYLVRHQFSNTDIVNYSTHVLFSSLKSTTALRGSLGYNGGYFSQHLYKLLGNKYTGFYEFMGIKATGEPNHTESINIDMHQGVPTNSEVHLMNALVTKNTKTNLAYIFTKVPYGKVEFSRKTTGIDGLSLLFKSATNFKEEDDKWIANNWVCWLNYNGSKGRLVSAGSIGKLDNTDMYLSKAGSELLSLGSVPELNDYKTTGIKIAGILNDTRRTNIIKAFIFYSGELSKAELEAEKNKTFKLKKFYRTNSNQSSFLGLEDIFTNNNTKEIIDGTIIDTTKTPIEYKEQKDISKTSDITSYTKNNINIEKSKCGYIRDIRNTNDFKNLPNNLVTEPSKYDEKYQSPTVNIVRVIDDKYGFGYGYNNTDGANVTIDNQILKTVIKNKNKSINSYPLTLIRQNSTSYIGKTLSISFLIKGIGTTFVDIHQIRSDTGQNSVNRGITIELTDEYTRYTISNFICNESHQNMAITVGNTVDIIEIKDIQVELSPVTTDYTPPNSDGNFIPTIGESGIFSVKQTTKDTDKNTNTFARTIFLP